MQFLDFLVILSITAVAGYLAGFMTVKINNLLVIVLGKLWSSGHAKKRYIPIGITVVSCYIVIILLVIDNTASTDPAFQTLEIVILTAIFSGLYAVGIYHADKRFKDAVIVMNHMIRVTYAKGDSPEEKKILDDTKKNAKAILDSMPKSNSHALSLLFFVFDSAMMVFFISLSSGRFRVDRFINLDPKEQEKYFETWSNNPYLYYAVQALKTMIGFSYYTSPGTWKAIDYNGTFLAGSYLR